jgi:hypothetical protein
LDLYSHVLADFRLTNVNLTNRSSSKWLKNITLWWNVKEKIVEQRLVLSTISYK